MHARWTLLLTLLALTLPLQTVSAQRKVSAQARVQTVMDGKVTTVTKTLYCQANGRMVTVFSDPYPYYVITNPLGESQLYIPSTHEVMQQTSEEYSDRDDLIYLFLSGRVEDMGLVYFGYSLVSSQREGDGIVKKTFRTTAAGKVPTVEVVTQNQLPIYLAYIDAGGKVLSRTYLSEYTRLPRFTMPARVTNIAYTQARDSVITRTTYSQIQVDVDDPHFSFQVPADAKPVRAAGPKRP